MHQRDPASSPSVHQEGLPQFTSMVSTSVTPSSVDRFSEGVCDTAIINDSGLHQSLGIYSHH